MAVQKLGTTGAAGGAAVTEVEARVVEGCNVTMTIEIVIDIMHEDRCCTSSACCWVPSLNRAENRSDDPKSPLTCWNGKT